MATDNEIKMMRYHRALNVLRKKETDSVKSILVMVNRYAQEQGDTRLASHQDLAERMIDYGIYKRVVEYAEGLIQDPDTLQKFMESIREDTGDPREALVRDYMQNIPQGSMFSPKTTLGDLIRFFRSAPAEVRYFIVVDDGTNVLKGIVSVNDFNRHVDELRTLEKDTPVINSTLFNGTPSVIADSDKMEFAANLFNEAQQAGKKITKLLVVNSSRKPVGFVAEPDIVRWETANL